MPTSIMGRKKSKNKTPEVRICQNCGNEYQPERPRSKSRFCSVKCWTTSDESKEIVRKSVRERHRLGKMPHPTNKAINICLYCKKEFKTYQSRKRKYCSQECSTKDMVGEKSFNWKGGVSPESATRCSKLSWKKFRAEIVKERGGKCELYESNGVMTVHHIIKVRDGGTNNRENLQVLCRRCHGSEEHFPGIMNSLKELCKQCIEKHKRDCDPTCPIYPFGFYKNIVDCKQKDCTNHQHYPYRDKK